MRPCRKMLSPRPNSCVARATIRPISGNGIWDPGASPTISCRRRRNAEGGYLFDEGGNCVHFEGYRTDAVSLIDIAPTLLRSADLDVPAQMHGEPLQTAPLNRCPSEAFAQTGHFNVGRVLRTQRWTCAVESIDGDPYGSRFRESHLYDLLEDPDQLHNRIAEHSCGRGTGATSFEAQAAYRCHGANRVLD
jgi:hypothetical protein